MREDSVFDLASLTEIYTSIALLRLVDAGRVELAAPVRAYLPECGAGPEVTVLLAGGVHNGVRLLSESLTVRMLTNLNESLPALDSDVPTRTSDHGLGVVLDQPWFMGGLSSPRTFGHTGFSGTSIVASPGHDLVLVLLTNRAHPNWEWADPNPVRARVANVVTDHLP